DLHRLEFPQYRDRWIRAGVPADWSLCPVSGDENGTRAGRRPAPLDSGALSVARALSEIGRGSRGSAGERRLRAGRRLAQDQQTRWRPLGSADAALDKREGRKVEIRFHPIIQAPASR